MKQKMESDHPWKEVLDVYFKQFLEFFWKDYYEEVDWTKGYRSLDKELIKISRNASIGNREADKLFEVHLKNGQKRLIFIHIEIQARRDSKFGERMLIYRYRIRDLYGKPVVTLAILIDPNENWRPNNYAEQLWGSKLEIQFPIVKLTDYKSRIEELKSSNNPFAQIVLIQLAAMENRDPEKRLVSKIELTRALYTKGWSKDDILMLYKFLDWMLTLPSSLASSYNQ